MLLPLYCFTKGVEKGEIDMKKFFLIAVVLNLALLIAYEIAHSFALLDFVKRSISANIAGFTWTPFTISIGYGISTVNPNGSIIAADGAVLIPNLQFFLLLSAICANLYIIWKIDRKS